VVEAVFVNDLFTAVRFGLGIISFPLVTDSGLLVFEIVSFVTTDCPDKVPDTLDDAVFGRPWGAEYGRPNGNSRRGGNGETNSFLVSWKARWPKSCAAAEDLPVLVIACLAISWPELKTDFIFVVEGGGISS